MGGEGEGGRREKLRPSCLNTLLLYLTAGAHVNLIPLNPTSGYGGGPSQREAF